MAKFIAPNRKSTDLSISWFEKMIKNFASNAKALKKEGVGEVVGHPQIGRVHFYFYDPKGKDVLPYYDKFPMTIPIEPYSDGFLGINLHYLPVGPRIALFEELMTIRSSSKVTETTKIRASYDLLKNAARFKDFEPCLKRYLFNHCRSGFLDINPKHWQTVISLPLQKFTKGSPY